MPHHIDITTSMFENVVSTNGIFLISLLSLSYNSPLSSGNPLLKLSTPEYGADVRRMINIRDSTDRSYYCLEDDVQPETQGKALF